MKEVILQVEDAAYERFMAMISLCPQVKVVCTDNDERKEVDNCHLLALTIRELQKNKVFRHPGDYTYVMLAVNQNVVKGLPFFYSPQDFVDFMKHSGIVGLPARNTLYNTKEKVVGDFPEWSFLDDPKPSESIRRNSIVIQFKSAFFRLKKGMLDGNLDNGGIIGRVFGQH